MKHLKKSFGFLMILTLVIASPSFAQQCSYFNASLRLPMAKQQDRHDRAMEIMLDNEYTTTGLESGNFYMNPLSLNGKPLDYYTFSLLSQGELTVLKGAAVSGYTIKVPFHVYLRRNGNKIFIPGKEQPDPTQIKVEISEVLKYAEPGDHLVIEPVRKEDGPAKRIIKLLKGGGC